MLNAFLEESNELGLMILHLDERKGLVVARQGIRFFSFSRQVVVNVKDEDGGVWVRIQCKSWMGLPDLGGSKRLEYRLLDRLQKDL